MDHRTHPERVLPPPVRLYSFPNHAVMPTKVAVFDDSQHAGSPFLRKCLRLRHTGPTPCYCCPGACVGEPRDAEEDAAFCRGDFSSREEQHCTACVAGAFVFAAYIAAIAFLWWTNAR